MTNVPLCVVRSIRDLRRVVAGWREAVERIGPVPTMVALHRGHLALVAASRAPRLIDNVAVATT